MAVASQLHAGGIVSLSAEERRAPQCPSVEHNAVLRSRRRQRLSVRLPVSVASRPSPAASSRSSPLPFPPGPLSADSAARDDAPRSPTPQRGIARPAAEGPAPQPQPQSQSQSQCSAFRTGHAGPGISRTQPHTLPSNGPLQRAAAPGMQGMRAWTATLASALVVLAHTQLPLPLQLSLQFPGAGGDAIALAEAGALAGTGLPYIPNPYIPDYQALLDNEERYVRPGWKPAITMEEAMELSGAGDEDGIAPDEPQQVHVSLWGPGRMIVTWHTTDLTAPSRVQFGTAPGQYTEEVEGEALTYKYLVYRSKLIHRAILGSVASPLQADTTYYYRCAGSDRELAFKTPPAEFPLNVAIVGDLGQTEYTVTTLQQIKQQPYDLLVLPGDLSYADRYQPRWDSWGLLIEPLASSRPWMVVGGNHEIEGIPLLQDSTRFVAYEARWPQPHLVGTPTTAASPSSHFYSFETAGVHWVMLSSYDDFAPGSEQYLWLQADLGAVDRVRTPWLIAVLHAPWYNSNYAHQGDGEAMRRSMERLLHDARTDILFAGHVHAYERSVRVYDNKVDPCGTVHIVIGDGGNREGLASRYYDPQPEWSAMREASFGHGELKFHADGTADWIWHRNDDDVEETADSVKIYSHAMAPAMLKDASSPDVCLL